MTGFDRKSRNKRSGFTLIELLTVVSIVGVLVVIALPEFQHFRQRAYDSTALSDVTQFRNAVANEDNPTSFWSWDTGPMKHTQFPEVQISNGVRMFNFSFDAGGQMVFYAIGCHVNGETGYLMIAPYGNFNPFAGWAEANEVLTNPGYRWVCP